MLLRSRILAVVALATIGLLPAVGSAAPAEQDATTLRVLATTTQIQDFTRNVGGDRVTVIPILGGDDDAHVYQPTAADARNVADADLVLANGVGLEPWLDR